MSSKAWVLSKSPQWPKHLIWCKRISTRTFHISWQMWVKFGLITHQTMLQTCRSGSNVGCKTENPERCTSYFAIILPSSLPSSLFLLPGKCHDGDLTETPNPVFETIFQFSIYCHQNVWRYLAWLSDSLFKENEITLINTQNFKHRKHKIACIYEYYVKWINYTKKVHITLFYYNYSDIFRPSNHSQGHTHTHTLSLSLSLSLSISHMHTHLLMISKLNILEPEFYI